MPTYEQRLGLLQDCCILAQVGYQAGNSKRESHSTASRQMAEAAAAQAPFTAVSARVDIVKAPHLPNILRHVTHLSTQVRAEHDID